MKLVRVSSLGFVLAATAWAQHGLPVGHVGSSHPSASFSSSSHSFSAPTTTASHSYGSAPPYRPNLTTQQRSAYTSPIGPAPFGGTQPYNRRRYPNGGYRPYYSRGVYLVPGWLNSGFYGYGYPDDSGYNDQQQSGPPPAEANAQVATPDQNYDHAYGQAPPRPPYEPQAAAAPAQDLPEQPEITLLFKDGRPPLQVQNYAATRTTLYVLDGPRRREISLDLLDLPQTEKANRDAGVDFEIPATAD